MIRCTVPPPVGKLPANQPTSPLLVAANPRLPTLSGPRTEAVAVSVAYVIRSIVVNPPTGPPPPANQASVVLPTAAKLYLPALSGPRVVAVAVSVANIIRFTIDNEPELPPNQAAVPSPSKVDLKL